MPTIFEIARFHQVNCTRNRRFNKSSIRSVRTLVRTPNRLDDC